MKNFFDLQRFVEEYHNDQPNKTLNGTANADYFENSGSIVKIYAAGGNDTVKNTGNLVTIAAGEGDNSVRSFGSNVSITAGKGDDYIKNYSENGKTEKIKIFAGDGNNTVSSGSSSSNVTIVSGKGTDSVKNYSDNAKISVGSGDDIIYNGTREEENKVLIRYGDVGGDSISAVGGKGKDTIENDGGDYATLFGGSDDDEIINYGGQYAKIFGDEGNDYIYNGYAGIGLYIVDPSYYYGDNVTISGGIGDDLIYNRKGSYDSLSGGAGNDSIYNNGGDYQTITGGAGSDLISLTSDSSINAIQYTYGDGNDTIFGFNENDTLYITTSSKFSTMKSGNDLYITFNNNEVITLKDVDTGVGGVGSKNIVTLKGGNSGGDDDGDKLPTGLSLSGTTMTASKNFKGSAIDLTKYPKVKTLNASAVTKALKITGNTLANKISGGSKNDTIYGGNGNDSLVGNAGNDKLFGDAGNDTLVGGAGNDTLTGGKGKDVFVHSKGNDVITDYTAGADAIRLSGTTLKSSKVSKKDVILTTDNGTITVKNGKGKELTVLMTVSSSTSALLSENNFAKSDNLSAIVKNDLSVSADKIETTTYETFTVKNDLITYSGK